MSRLGRYTVEITLEIRHTVDVRAESEIDATAMAVSEFRDWFAENYDAAPSTSELDIFVEEL